jgi:hypothetical protein
MATCTLPCATNQHQTQTCTSTTNRVCQACGEEKYCDGLIESNCTAQCVPGKYESTACTSSTNRVCSDCVDGFFCLGQTHIHLCASQCLAGTYQTTACTSTTDRMCSPCPPNSFCEGNTHMAQCTAPCLPTFHETTPCTSSTNRVCETCPANSFCVGGGSMEPCVARCGNETHETAPCTQVSNRVCTACAARCVEGWYEESSCTEFTDRKCKELQKNVTVAFTISVPAPVIQNTTNETAPELDLSIYKTVVASTLDVNPEFVEVSLVPFDQSARRRLLQSEVKLYFRIKIPVLNVSVSLANYTLNNTESLNETVVSLVPNVTQLVELVAEKVQSASFEAELVAAFVEAEIEILDVSTAYAVLAVELPPCPPNSYCVGSDVFPCSGPCIPGTYRTKNCTAASDQTCSACPLNHFCLGGIHHQVCRASCPAGDI